MKLLETGTVKHSDWESYLRVCERRTCESVPGIASFERGTFLKNLEAVRLAPRFQLLIV